MCFQFKNGWYLEDIIKNSSYFNTFPGLSKDNMSPGIRWSPTSQLVTPDTWGWTCWVPCSLSTSLKWTSLLDKDYGTMLLAGCLNTDHRWWGMVSADTTKWMEKRKNESESSLLLRRICKLLLIKQLLKSICWSNQESRSTDPSAHVQS